MHAVDTSDQPPALADAIAAVAASSGPADGGHGRGRTQRDAALVAATPETAWCPRVRHAAWRLAQGQRFEPLAVHGIDATALAEPPRAAEGPLAVRAVFCSEHQIVVAFSFDRELRQATGALPERRYDLERRGWTLPASRPSAEAPASLLGADPGFTVESAAYELLRALPTGQHAGPPARSAEPSGRAAFRPIPPAPAWRRDRALLAALLDWDAARFYRAGPGRDTHWRIDLRDHDAQQRFLALLAEPPEIALDDRARAVLPGQTVAAVADPKPLDTRWVKTNTTTFTVAAGNDPTVGGGVGGQLGTVHDRTSGRPVVSLELRAAALGDSRRDQHDSVAFLRAHHCCRAALTRGLSREAARRLAVEVARDAGERAQRVPGLVEMNTLRRLLADAKRPAVRDWVARFLTSDEKLVLFAAHRNIQAALGAAFRGCTHIVAGDDPDTPLGTPTGAWSRQAQKRRFHHDPAHQLIVCSLAIAGEGHTLTAASRGAFAELRALLAREQGDERCDGEGQLAHTDRGRIPIEAMEFGDRVLTHRGHWQPVRATSSKSAPELLEIDHARGAGPLRWTPEHELWVLPYRDAAWVEAAELKISDCLALPGVRGTAVSALAVPDRASSGALCRWFLHLFTQQLPGAPGKARFAAAKRLLSALLRLGREQAFALLWGCCSGDAYLDARRGRVRRSSLSPHLAPQVALLTALCGYEPSNRRFDAARRPAWGGHHGPGAKPRQGDVTLNDDEHVWNPVPRVRRVAGRARAYKLSVDVERTFDVGSAAVHNYYGRLSDLHGATCHYLLGVSPERWGDAFRTLDEVTAARVDAKRHANVSAANDEANERVRGESILGEVLGQLTDTDSSVSVRSPALTHDKDPRCPLQTTTTTRSSARRCATPAPNSESPLQHTVCGQCRARRPCTAIPKRFGSSTAGIAAAGLGAYTRPVPRYSDEELLRRLAAVAPKLGAAASRDPWLAQQLTVSTVRSLCLLWSEMAQFTPNRSVLRR